jgi:hypothetical protein
MSRPADLVVGASWPQPRQNATSLGRPSGREMRRVALGGDLAAAEVVVGLVVQAQNDVVRAHSR